MPKITNNICWLLEAINRKLKCGTLNLIVILFLNIENLISVENLSPIFNCMTVTLDQNIIFGNKDMTYSIWSIKDQKKLF
jgi:hypothetical protein